MPDGHGSMSGLYIHIPFCQKKCFYCSFVVAVNKKNWIDGYLDALAREASRYRGRQCATVYIGGGSPSFLSVEEWARLVMILRENFSWGHGAEVSVECNPEDVTREKARAFAEAGVTRVSLGAQTFDDRALAALGRCHDRAAALRAVETLRTAGFENINVDLMIDIPGQTRDGLDTDIATLRSLQVEHVSCYSLTVEPGSRFFVQGGQQSGDEGAPSLYINAVEGLEAAGWRQYEVSNFCRPGYESRHNLNYWQGGNYLGLGVGAHSHEEGHRWWNIVPTREYIAALRDGAAVIAGEERLTGYARLCEAVVFGLRMCDGIDLAGLGMRFGVSLAGDEKGAIERFVEEGFLAREGDRVRTTRKGLLVLDEISSSLVSVGS